MYSQVNFEKPFEMTIPDKKLIFEKKNFKKIKQKTLYIRLQNRKSLSTKK